MDKKNRCKHRKELKRKKKRAILRNKPFLPPHSRDHSSKGETHTNSLIDSEIKKMFDISESNGTNKSEQILVRLCRKLFLSLWSYPNIYLYKEKKPSREVADILIIFGNDVIIFSDKDITFTEDISHDLELAWSRWYKKAVEDSASQLYGALKTIKQSPGSLFLDAKCTYPLQVKLPPADSARYHLIAVTRGSKDACINTFPGSNGSFRIDTSVIGHSAHKETPFTIGMLDRQKPFIHVFDEFSLEVIMDDMNTITDFLKYLREREAFITNPTPIIRAAGEEHLFASYLTNMDGEEHSFITKAAKEKQFNIMVFDESLYGGLKNRPEYKRKKREEKESFFWDKLIDHIIDKADPTITLKGASSDHDSAEEALREMASESRLHRRIFSKALITFIKNAYNYPGQTLARTASPKEDPSEKAYVFMVVAKYKSESFDAYRDRRRRQLSIYCKGAGLKYPQVVKFIGIAIDHPNRDYPQCSEDLIVYPCEKFNNDDRVKVELACKELVFFSNGFNMHEVGIDEFPQA